jgi:hypothetical protein
MLRRTPLALVLIAALVGGGCGTMDNVKRPTFPPPQNSQAPVCRFYGGVRGDWTLATEYPWSRTPSYLDYVIIPVMMVINLGLDVAGDTVTLPYTLVAEGRRAYGSPSSSAEPTGSAPVAPESGTATATRGDGKAK